MFMDREEIEEIVKILRLNLYNRGLLCEAHALRQELEKMEIRPLPSLRTINRILSRHELTNRRIGYYDQS